MIHRTERQKIDTQEQIRLECEKLADFLVAKNEAYGNSFANPINIFTKQNAETQLLVRIDDKLNRLAHGSEYIGDDTVLDLIGYLILLRVLRKQNA